MKAFKNSPNKRDNSVCTAHGSILPHLLSFDENVRVIVASTRLDELLGRCIVRATSDCRRKSGSFRSQAAEEGHPKALRRSSLRTRELFSGHAADISIAGWPRRFQSSAGTDAARTFVRNSDDHQLLCADTCTKIRDKPRDKHQPYGHHRFRWIASVPEMVRVLHPVEWYR